MNSSSLQSLQENVRGTLITPDHPDYDAARAVYNGMIDKRPAAILQVSQVADVMAGVNFARDTGMDVALRGGGHSAPGFGTCDGGLVIDFVNRRGVRFDPATATARAEAGATWADFNHATHAFGLGTPGGIIGSTGVTGLTLGGGIGYLSRKYGLSCDNLKSADVVTADGNFRVASATENDDLFWALRGGTGNFGVVTSLEFNLHPVDMVYGGVVIYLLEHAEAVGQLYRETLATAPEDLGVFMGFHQGPEVPFLAEEYRGRPVVVMVGGWTGPQEEGPRQWQPFLDVAPVAGSFVGPLPYPVLNTLFDESLPKGLQAYWKAEFLPTFSDEVIKVAKHFGEGVPSLQTANHFYPINGAVQRIAKDATAFPYRDADIAAVIAGMWEGPVDNDANIRWVREYATELHEHSAGGAYINFMDADDQSRIRDNYADNYDRLGAVKAKYDPDNLFHINQNIKPAA
ncbi:FAD-binding oxidoreductase [Pseudarthrobacter sulfonivorans]|uniref:FAD-binding oxidoreductase n=1 Tax=Pseudarthrobacter sulfonivorans TaxID=121292 RepID=UPI00210671C2|nr:FAD-binding oxidoreductase [Pseudarthrobacter sulfonivorans]